MTTSELFEKVNVRRLQQGCYKVTIEYRHKFYSCTSNDSLAWDDLGSEHRVWYKTDKQCLMAFYNECKRKNNL